MYIICVIVLYCENIYTTLEKFMALQAYLLRVKVLT